MKIIECTSNNSYCINFFVKVRFRHELWTVSDDLSLEIELIGHQNETKVDLWLQLWKFQLYQNIIICLSMWYLVSLSYLFLTISNVFSSLTDCLDPYLDHWLLLNFNSFSTHFQLNPSLFQWWSFILCYYFHKKKFLWLQI